MNRAHEKRLARREIIAELEDLALDFHAMEFAMDWGLIGRCAECDGLREDGACMGEFFNCSLTPPERREVC